MKRNFTLALALGVVLFSACNKKADTPDEYLTTDTTGVLRTLADFPVGVGVKLDLFKADAAYLNIAQDHFNSITPENELKHNTIVTNEGVFDFSRADEIVNLAQTKGLTLFGHTLVDWQSANTTYYRSLQSSAGATEVNAVSNADFESGTGNVFSDWTTQVGAGATGSFQQETATPYAGARSMKAVVSVAGPLQYTMQAYTTTFSLTQGNSYTLSFYAKAAVNGSKFKAVIQNNTYQEKTFFVTQEWAKYTWTFTANEATASLKFHFPAEGTFYFDNISIPKLNSGIDPVKLDNALHSFISQTVARFAGKINAWDVVNEPLEDGTGKIMTNPQPGTTTANKFYFAEVLGRDYIENALRYAYEANPNAQLYINEAKLESDPVKLDSMITLIKQLKLKGVPLHGIGLQMHLTIKNDRQGIENALQKLAATGLKIRISEMDVRVNPWNYFGYTPSQEDLIAQRDLYRFAIGAYYRLVPASQRTGVTFWDPSDKYSWIMINQGKDDAPTLFDKNNAKKPAYYGVVVAMRKKQ